MDYKEIIAMFYDLFKDFLALVLGDEKAGQFAQFEQDIKDIIEAEY